tara:strand:+ start:1005 stop:1217 length:213 start_codon:yes stop_codon:yes gene_type:complete
MSEKIVFDIKEEEVEHLKAAAEAIGFPDMGQYLVNLFLRLSEAIEACEEARLEKEFNERKANERGADTTD